MNHHRWASKQLIVPIAIALALVPALRAAESSPRPPLDEKTGGAERAAAPPELAHQSSGAPQPPPQPAAERELIQPPEVTYQDGQLTIVAENSLLSEVMKALRAALGADIDLPSDVADQHIWVHLGPGPARRVVRDLLDGTEFNYVIQASRTDADGILSVLLTQRSKPTGADKVGAPERSAVRRMPGTGSNAQSSTDSENALPEPVASGDPSQGPAAPAPVASVDPSQAPAAPASVPAPPSNASLASLQNTPLNSASAPLSPPTDRDQQIQTLQSMYQQRKQLQMQMNQNQKAPAQN